MAQLVIPSRHHDRRHWSLELISTALLRFVRRRKECPQPYLGYPYEAFWNMCNQHGSSPTEGSLHIEHMEAMRRGATLVIWFQSGGDQVGEPQSRESAAHFAADLKGRIASVTPDRLRSSEAVAREQVRRALSSIRCGLLVPSPNHDGAKFSNERG